MAASTSIHTHRLLLLLVLLLPLAALGFVPAAHRALKHQLPTTVAAAAPAAAATETGVVAETLILPMGDDTQLKIRFHQENFKTLALRTNQVCGCVGVVLGLGVGIVDDDGGMAVGDGSCGLSD